MTMYLMTAGTPLRAAALALAALTLTACVPPSAVPDGAPAPAFPEAAEVVARGSVQIEGGSTLTRANEVSTATVGEFRARVGLLRGVEGRLSFNPLNVTTTAGRNDLAMDDIVVGAKAHLLDASDAAPLLHPELGLALETSIPRSSGFLDHTNPSVTLTANWALGDRLAATFTGAATSANAPSREIEFTRAIGFDYKVTPKVDPYLEVGLEHTPVTGDRSRYLKSGLTLGIMSGVAIDVRYQAERTSDAFEHTVGVGIARRW